MGKPFLDQINCPACDAMQSVMTWSEIDAVGDPEARARLFAGEINAFHCQQCGYAGQIVVPLFYDDSMRRYAVQYFPEDWLDDEEFLDRWVNASGGTEAAALPTWIRQQSGYRALPHVVFDLDEMLRYIRFQEALWNRTHRLPDDT